MFDGGTLLGLIVLGTLYGLYRYNRSISQGSLFSAAPADNLYAAATADYSQSDDAAEEENLNDGVPIYETAHHMIESEDPMRRGYGNDDTTYGDARYADFTRPDDAALMREVLGQSHEGIFLNGALGGFDDDWEWHQECQMFYTGPRHILTVARTRSGKGACAIIPNLLCSTRSIICIDPKGQNAAVTARFRARTSQTFLLNPFNEHGLGTARFNPLAHLSIHDPNVFADVASLSEALILTEGKDPHWPDSARNLVACLLLHLIATEGGKATLPQMRAILGLPEPRLRLKIEEMAASPHSFIAELAGQFLGDTSEIKNIVSTARTQTKFLSDPAMADPKAGLLTGDDFRIADFKKRISTLYVILPARHMAAYARFLRLIVVSALDQLTATPGGIKTLFMLDEFPLLGHLSAIETAFGLAAGHNVQIWPFVQNLNQLRDIYGETRWEDFISGCGVVQWFTPNDTFTAEYLSRRIGDYTQFTESRSTGESSGTSENTGESENTGRNQGRGGLGKHISEGEGLSSGRGTSSGTSSNVSYSKFGKRLWPVNNVLALPEDKQFVTLNGFQYPILGVRRPYYHIRGIAEYADVDPFHAKQPAA